jgi:serine O-acetyltransferase
LVTLRSRVEDGEESSETTTTKSSSSSANHHASKPSLYNLGIGKNRPVFGDGPTDVDLDELYWNVAEAVHKPLNATSTQRITPPQITRKVVTAAATAAAAVSSERRVRRVRKMVAKTQEDASLRGAIWHEEHYNKWKEIPLSDTVRDQAVPVSSIVDSSILQDYEAFAPPKPQLFYPDIDLSIPEEVYSDETDAVWDLMRWEAFQEAKREPLLVSFLYSSILNHQHLESSLAFLLASRLSSPAMISTQIQSLILEALEKDKSIGRKLRADIMAVRDRDPACTCLPDVFLYFKGFHALQTYRVANVLWKNGKRVISRYLQSQMSQTFQIDIHPNATLGSGIMFDHGTGIVIGETATVGNNCSILHHVTLGGSGKKGVDRHPKVGNGVLLGAGASVVGNIKIGDGCQVGAGTLVITDIPAHSVAVGVPAKIIGSFVDVTEQPSVEMNQMMDRKIITFQTDGI